MAKVVYFALGDDIHANSYFSVYQDEFLNIFYFEMRFRYTQVLFSGNAQEFISQNGSLPSGYFIKIDTKNLPCSKEKFSFRLIVKANISSKDSSIC